MPEPARSADQRAATTVAAFPGAQVPQTAVKEPPFIRIDHVTKRFGTFTAVSDVTLEIQKGEIFSLLGGSGCGKTTLLWVLAAVRAAARPPFCGCWPGLRHRPRAASSSTGRT